MPVQSTEKARHLLRHHDLRVTDSRALVLDVFIDSPHALSQPDLERALGDDFDRVTIYRSLTSFLEKGLIHKVLDDSGAAKFALCAHDHEAHRHADSHVHFKCLECGTTQCLDDLGLPDFKAPAGYTFESTNILVEGVCPRCGRRRAA
jgi:Fur family transcriptional regulator, ferric uptake regulator